MVFGGAVKWWESYRLSDCRQVGRRGSKNALAKARHHRSVVAIEDEGVRLACQGVHGGLEGRPDVTVEMLQGDPFEYLQGADVFAAIASLYEFRNQFRNQVANCLRFVLLRRHDGSCKYRTMFL